MRTSRWLRGWRRELALFIAVDLLYDLGRGAFAARLSVARAHAHWVFHLERSLHFAIEASVQHALSGSVSTFVLANVYLSAQLMVLPVALVWVYRRSADIYRDLRNTVIGVWAIALPVFALYPVAPPRLAGIGLKDSVTEQGAVALTGHSTLFYNPYAAVPSLHVGLAFAIGVAIAASVRRRPAKLLAFAWGPLVAVSVVATGNHYVFDVATGLLAAAVGFAVSRLSRRLPARPQAVPVSLGRLLSQAASEGAPT
ncbi:MAG: phosphatase PAP2 family protein [Solirubrobacterales bacterium]|nr:phosphatase PAP2 family protein [Solirubrobacterales bacterium]